MSAAASRPAIPFTYGLLVLMVLAFAGLDLWEEGPVRLIRAGALYGPLLRSGDWWRLLSYGFLHAGYAHLLSNGYALYAMGPQIEQVYGRARFLCLFLLPVAFGGLVSAYLRRSDVPVVGASGGAFGLLGAQIVLGVRLWPRMSDEGQRAFVRGTGVVVALNVGLALLVRNIDHFAHAGGFLCGVALAAPVTLSSEAGPPRARPGGWPPRIVATVCGLVLLWAGVAIAGLRLHPWGFGEASYVSPNAGLRVRALRGLVPVETAPGDGAHLLLEFPGLRISVWRHRGAAASSSAEALLAERAREFLTPTEREPQPRRDDDGHVWLMQSGDLAHGLRVRCYVQAVGDDLLEIDLASSSEARDLALPDDVWPLLWRVERLD